MAELMNVGPMSNNSSVNIIRHDRLKLLFDDGQFNISYTNK